MALIKQQLLKIGHGDLTNITYETQNAEYEGICFNVGQYLYRSRLAKRTPKKAGYFVAFWEKDSNSKNQPYVFQDSPDKLIVSIVDKEKIGQFIFPKAVLHEQGILKSETSKGKMAIRIYPTWEKDLNPSATKTKKWQSAYFIDLTKDTAIDKRSTLYYS
ncbi:MepB family protein [Marinilactibacillus kalidii]|uniref:MepB family protein n=1 Tax=Marinilactibacillus kalidii TaxID=2820274 RepID=UPI001ABE1A2F|nr:MepB family protein [Marinilactibacillus kalidii]